MARATGVSAADAILNSARGNYIYLLSYLLTHHFICERHWREFGIYDDLAYDFMRLKWDCNKRISYYHINLISLGDNCLPANLLTRWGLLPTLRQAERLGLPYRGRLPFDKAVHNLALACNLLNSDFADYRPEAVETVDGVKRFTIMREGKYACFLHDSYDEGISESANILNFHELLKKRAELFQKRARDRKTIFILRVDKEKASSINDLNALAKSKYGADLLAISPYDPPAGCECAYLKYVDPRPGYRHFDVRDWFCDAGFNFEYGIINFILSYIEAKFRRGAPSPMQRLPLRNLYTHVAKAYADQGKPAKARDLLERALAEDESFRADIWLATYSRINQASGQQEKS